MYQPEIHRTIQKVQLLEQLDFDLTITDRSYQSEHSALGKLRVHRKADERVIADREQPPRHPIGLLIDEAFDGKRLGSSFPGTQLYVGLAYDPHADKDETAFQEDHMTEAVEVDGIPRNGTAEFDLDWELEEARESTSGDVTFVEDREYDISGLPSDSLPVIVRARLYRDANRLANVLEREETENLRGQHRFEGLAALVVELEHRDTAGGEGKPLRIEAFSITMSRTFPNITFAPEQGSTYDPESRQVEWKNELIAPNEQATYAIVGPMEELLNMDRVTGSLRAELIGRTLSGMLITDLFDESGSKFKRGAQGGDTADITHKTTITANIEIDPSARRGEAREVSRASVSVAATPREVFDEVIKICDRNGIHIVEREPPGDGEPVVGRDGVFHVDNNPGELDVRREYGDEGVVYAGMEVTGRFTAEARETQVSAFDETEDRLVRKTEGGLDDRGRSTLEIRARSASSELNSRFISTIENELEG